MSPIVTAYGHAFAVPVHHCREARSRVGLALNDADPETITVVWRRAAENAQEAVVLPRPSKPLMRSKAVGGIFATQDR